MITASQRFGVSRHDYDFFYLNNILEDWDTPESVAMEDLGLVEMRRGF